MESQPIRPNLEIGDDDGVNDVDDIIHNSSNDISSNNNIDRDRVLDISQNSQRRTQNVVIDEEDLDLVYGASSVIMLFVPITVCMLCVAFTVSTVGWYTKKDVYLIYTPFHDETDNSGTIAWQTVANTLIVLSVVIVMTFIVLILYKYNCLKVLYGYLIFATLAMLTLYVYIYMFEVCTAHQIPMDYFTLALFIWNFAAVGLMVIHWKGPLRLQQIYHIIISSLMALIFIKYLPEWTLWLLLAAISCWDLIAVLCPNGPLRMLVEEAQARSDHTFFPSLIYSTTMLIPVITMADGVESVDPMVFSTSNRNQISGTSEAETESPVPRKRNKRKQERSPHQPESEEEERGVKLGLGDFIFYSVLIGKAHSYGDWNTTIACYIAILMGLCGTLFFVAIYRKPLPALPISIFTALIFYFGTNQLIRPFSDSLAVHQVYI